MPGETNQENGENRPSTVRNGLSNYLRNTRRTLGMIAGSYLRGLRTIANYLDGNSDLEELINERRQQREQELLRNYPGWSLSEIEAGVRVLSPNDQTNEVNGTLQQGTEREIIEATIAPNQEEVLQPNVLQTDQYGNEFVPATYIQNGDGLTPEQMNRLQQRPPEQRSNIGQATNQEQVLNELRNRTKTRNRNKRKGPGLS